MGVVRKEKIIGEIAKGNSRKLLIRAMTATDEKGTVVKYGDIRTFENGRKAPFATKSGITVAPKHIDDLIVMLENLKAELDSKQHQVQAVVEVPEVVEEENNELTEMEVTEDDDSL